MAAGERCGSTGVSCVRKLRYAREVPAVVILRLEVLTQPGMAWHVRPSKAASRTCKDVGIGELDFHRNQLVDGRRHGWRCRSLQYHARYQHRATSPSGLSESRRSHSIPYSVNAPSVGTTTTARRGLPACSACERTAYVYPHTYPQVSPDRAKVPRLLTRP